jgi:hypothetical protein
MAVAPIPPFTGKVTDGIGAAIAGASVLGKRYSQWCVDAVQMSFRVIIFYEASDLNSETATHDKIKAGGNGFLYFILWCLQ